MSKRTGLISHEGDDGLLYVFVPGRHPDLVIDQRKISSDENRFHIGDFISFLDLNNSIVSPVRINKLFETRFSNNRLQVKAPVAFPPTEFCEQASLTSHATSVYKIFAWSPDFALVDCSPDVANRLSPNRMYKAWIERYPQMVQNVAGMFVSWKIVGDVSDECDERTKQLISKAPWKRAKNRQPPQANADPDYGPEKQQKPLSNFRHFVASLKKYIDNYEGLVTAVHDSSAKVWSLAIPESEVVFFLGARKGLKVGDWIRFNCTSSTRPCMGCYLQGKKFEVIEPVLPAKAFNDTVQVKVMTTVAVNNLKYYPTGEVTLETEMLGAVEFGPRKFRHNYCNRYLSLIVCKNTPSKQTGAVWEVLSVFSEGSMDFTQHSNSVVNFSNISDNSSDEFISTKKVECNTKDEFDGFHDFTENNLQQPDLLSSLPQTSEKEVDDSFYPDFIYNVNNHDAENMRREEENDPLAELAFGAVEPHVLEVSSSICSNDVDEFAVPVTKIPSISLENFQKQEELNRLALEYWVQAWQIPEVRQHIKEANRALYANIMQLMMNVNARNSDDSLEVLKPLSVLNIK